MLSIQTNVNSLVAQQNLNTNSIFQSKTIQQLTSGYRINSSGDDAAGLAVANKFRSSVSELTQGVANGNDAAAQLQIMDGGINNISQILDRLKTLATQSASGTFTGNRTTLNSEFQTDLAEIDRQAQSIGLDTGGLFAKNLSVYLGSGSGSTSATNMTVSMDLTSSTVDAQSLGLKGMQAIAGTVAAAGAGTDIGTGSVNGTTVQNIMSTAAGNNERTAGYATFYFSGPGFSDNSKVAVAANLSNVSDITSLVSAMNTAIQNAGNGATQSAQGLKAANVVASVNTDQFGHQQLAFSSSTTAFQVQAGDQMANAFMGNFDSGGATAASGLALKTSVTGAATTPGGGFTASGITVQVSGASLAAPVSFTFANSISLVSGATANLVSQVSQNAQLQAAGISAAVDGSNRLVFTSADGETFQVQANGDTANSLGLGSFLNSSGAGAYSSIIATNPYATQNTGNGLSSLAFSINGAVTGGITAATKVGDIAGTGYNVTAGSATGINNPNGGSNLGIMTLTVSGNKTVTVDFNNDANKSGTESVQQVADYINTQMQAQLGYGSDVKVATVTAVTNTITLTGIADGTGNTPGTIAATDSTGTPATKLGLTGAATTAASGTVGNTIAVNLSAGDATAATTTGTSMTLGSTSAGVATVNTFGKQVQLNIDGKVVTTNFTEANDANSVGLAAAYTSGLLAADATTQSVNITSLQSLVASTTGSAIAASSAATTLSLGSLGAGAAVFTGSNILSSTNPVGGDSSLVITLTNSSSVTSSHTFNESGAASLAVVAGDITTWFAANRAGSATIVASVVNDGTNQHLVLTSSGTGSTGTTAAIQVTNGVAATDFGLNTTGSPVSHGGTASTNLILSVDGVATGVSVDVSGANSVDAVKNLINAAVYSATTNNAAYQTSVATDATAGKLALNGVKLGLANGGTLSFTNNAAAQMLGLTSLTDLTTTTVNGQDKTALTVSVDGRAAGATKTVDLTSVAVDASGQARLNDIVTAINSQLNTAYSTTTAGPGSGPVTYAQAVTVGAGKGIQLVGYIPTVASAITGSQSDVAVTNNVASQLLGLTTAGTSASTTVTGSDETLAQAVSYLNSQAQKALGLSTTATVVSVNGANRLVIDSQNKGLGSTISLVNANTTAGFDTLLGLAGINGTPATGTGRTLDNIVSTLNQYFTSNATLQEAGLTAINNTGDLQIQSSNGTQFRMDAWGTVFSGRNSDLGFGTSGQASNTVLGQTGSTFKTLDAQGASAIGTFANTPNATSIDFNAMKFGNDDQAITISANSSTGVQQPLTITLRNDGTAQTGASIDAAVSALNTALQQSDNATLRSIVAVKEDYSGTEKINFISSLSAFTVSVGSSAGAGVNDGLNNGQAHTFTSTMNGAASNAAVDTQTGAAAAVTAITAAVGKLGAAQAAVGKGENQLSYAISLAQSQITNFAAAESNIRDANVAQQAANLTKAQVLQQASIAAMAQANSAPQAVLTLLRG